MRRRRNEKGEQEQERVPAWPRSAPGAILEFRHGGDESRRESDAAGVLWRSRVLRPWRAAIRGGRGPARPAHDSGSTAIFQAGYDDNVFRTADARTPSAHRARSAEYLILASRSRPHRTGHGPLGRSAGARPTSADGDSRAKGEVPLHESPRGSGGRADRQLGDARVPGLGHAVFADRHQSLHFRSRCGRQLLLGSPREKDRTTVAPPRSSACASSPDAPPNLPSTFSSRPISRNPISRKRINRPRTMSAAT